MHLFDTRYGRFSLLHGIISIRRTMCVLSFISLHTRAPYGSKPRI